MEDHEGRGAEEEEERRRRRRGGGGEEERRKKRGGGEGKIDGGEGRPQHMEIDTSGDTERGGMRGVRGYQRMSAARPWRVPFEQ